MFGRMSPPLSASLRGNRSKISDALRPSSALRIRAMLGHDHEQPGPVARTLADPEWNTASPTSSCCALRVRQENLRT
jgi:hypothetical protein